MVPPGFAGFPPGRIKLLMTGGVLFAGLLFGMIGCGAFMWGKRQSSAKHMLLGVALMVYPYFISDLTALYAMGSLLTAALFFFNS